MEKEALEAAAAAVASKTTYAGAAVSVYGWITSSEFAALVGVLGVVVGIAVNWYYKAKANRRSEELFRARMERIKAGYRSDTDLAAFGEDD